MTKRLHDIRDEAGYGILITRLQPAEKAKMKTRIYVAHGDTIVQPDGLHVRLAVEDFETISQEQTVPIEVIQSQGQAIVEVELDDGRIVQLSVDEAGAILLRS